MKKKEFTAEEVNMIARQNWIAGKSNEIIQLKWVLEKMKQIENSVNVLKFEYWNLLRIKVKKHIKQLKDK